MVVRMLSQEFPTMPLEQRMAHSYRGSPRSPVSWPPCALGEGGTGAALGFPAPHSHSIPSSFSKEDWPSPVLWVIFHLSCGPDGGFSHRPRILAQRGVREGLPRAPCQGSWGYSVWEGTSPLHRQGGQLSLATIFPPHISGGCSMALQLRPLWTA